MRKMLVVLAGVLLIAGSAYAFQEYNFTCDGYGNMVKVSPPLYNGPISGGDLAPGSWSITVDDTDWPAISDPVGRWAYIWANYYVYNPITHVWRGDFYGNNLYLEHTGVGTMRGYADLTFQIPDRNQNGQLDAEECYDGLSGVVFIVQEGTGLYSTLCGQGSYSGTYTRTCDVPPEDPSYMLDDMHIVMHLDLEECGMATQPSTWGMVKALFK